MRISIIHPTRNRPQLASETANKWLRSASCPNCIEYILSVDVNDRSNYMGFREPLRIVVNSNRSAIDAINIAAKYANGDLFVVVSDDFDCPPHWDALLKEALRYKHDFIVKTDDKYQKTLITLPIMDRAYYNRFGYIYHPDYLHMFSDQHMTAVGHLLGKVITLPLVFEHRHYTVGKSVKDAVNVRNDSTWAQGLNVYNRHLANNFGVENPVMKYADIQWK